MCNLYSHTSNQEAIRRLFRVKRDRAGNLPPLPSIYPDGEAPIVRAADGGRELVTGRWGMPSPPAALVGRNADRGVTNIRNTASPHWRAWLKVEHRCLMPFTSFAEHETLPDGSRPTVWFALSPDRPLAAFAGLRTRWQGSGR